MSLRGTRAAAFMPVPVRQHRVMDMRVLPVGALGPGHGVWVRPAAGARATLGLPAYGSLLVCDDSLITFRKRNGPPISLAGREGRSLVLREAPVVMVGRPLIENVASRRG